jgi:hypothetical protein
VTGDATANAPAERITRGMLVGLDDARLLLGGVSRATLYRLAADGTLPRAARGTKWTPRVATPPVRRGRDVTFGSTSKSRSVLPRPLGSPGLEIPEPVDDELDRIADASFAPPQKSSRIQNSLCAKEVWEAIPSRIAAFAAAAASATPEREPLRQAARRAFDVDRDSRALEFVAELIGVPAPGRGVWSIGGHEIAVEWWPGDDEGRNLLRVSGGWPVSPGKRALILAQVLGNTTVGDLRDIRGPELGRWANRLALEAGIIARPDVRLAPLPPGAPDDAKITLEAIRRTLEVRRVTDPPGEPLPLSAPFLARWWGVEENVVRRGKRALERLAVIERVGEQPSAYGRPTVLWSVRGADGNPA